MGCRWPGKRIAKTEVRIGRGEGRERISLPRPSPLSMFARTLMGRAPVMFGGILGVELKDFRAFCSHIDSL